MDSKPPGILRDCMNMQGSLLGPRCSLSGVCRACLPASA